MMESNLSLLFYYRLNGGTLERERGKGREGDILYLSIVLESLSGQGHRLGDCCGYNEEG